MKVNVNQQYGFELEINDDAVIVNGSPLELDYRSLSGSTSHVRYNNQSHNIEIVSINPATKTVEVKVNGHTYEVVVEDQYDQLLKKMGFNIGQAARITELRSPMPGLVLSVNVAEGAEVSKGDSLLILEAMKMENVIKSPSSGVVKSIKAAKGDKVEKNQILIEFK